MCFIRERCPWPGGGNHPAYAPSMVQREKMEREMRALEVRVLLGECLARQLQNLLASLAPIEKS